MPLRKVSLLGTVSDVKIAPIQLDRVSNNECCCGVKV